MAKIFEILNKLQENSYDIKGYFLTEINKIKEEINILNNRIKELQEIVVGCKLLKIILKKLLNVPSFHSIFSSPKKHYKTQKCCDKNYKIYKYDICCE